MDIRHWVLDDPSGSCVRTGIAPRSREPVCRDIYKPRPLPAQDWDWSARLESHGEAGTQKFPPISVSRRTGMRLNALPGLSRVPQSSSLAQSGKIQEALGGDGYSQVEAGLMVLCLAHVRSRSFLCWGPWRWMQCSRRKI